MKLRSLFSSWLLLLLMGSTHAAKPQPMTPSPLPLERVLKMTLLVPDDLFVLQEDQIKIIFLPMTPSSSTLTATQTFATGAAVGIAALAVTEGIALSRKINDRKRVERIEAKLGTVAWGARLRAAVMQSLAPEGLAPGFDFSTDVPRLRIGARKYYVPCRACGLFEGHVAFTPTLRGLRIHLAGVVEDRRVIRDTQLRLRQERLPLRSVRVEYLIVLPDDVDLNQRKRTDRWAAQDPQAFAAAIEAGIAEVVRLVNGNWQHPDHDVELGETVRFRMDKGIHAKGQVLERDQQRVLIVDGDGMLHSVPEELLGRGWFD